MLKNESKNAELQNLINQVNQSKAAVINVETKLTEISSNITRNSSMIAALKTENQELESRSNQATVSDSGAVDFAQFDDFSEQISKNNRKIVLLNNVIDRFEKEKRYLLLSEYESAITQLQSNEVKLFNFYATNLLDELFTDNSIVEKFNNVVNSLRFIGKPLTDHSGYNDGITNIIITKLLSVITSKAINLQGYKYHQQAFSIPNVDSKWKKQEELQQLAQELNKELN